MIVWILFYPDEDSSMEVYATREIAEHYQAKVLGSWIRGYEVRTELEES